MNTEIISYLIKIANKYDSEGFYAISDIFDECINIVKRASENIIIDFFNGIDNLNSYFKNLSLYNSLKEKEIITISEKINNQLDKIRPFVKKADIKISIDKNQQMVDNLFNLYNKMLNSIRLFSDYAQIPIGMKQLLDQIKELGANIGIMKQNLKTNASYPIKAIKNLSLFADYLDYKNKYIHADVVDKTIKIIADEEGKIKPGFKSSLSTRYCPDHIGVATFRNSTNEYQCPLDGRIYNYETGYSDYSGQIIPGGSIANQTPSATPYAGPQRIYDSRQSVINTIN